MKKIEKVYLTDEQFQELKPSIIDKVQIEIDNCGVYEMVAEYITDVFNDDEFFKDKAELFTNLLDKKKLTEIVARQLIDQLF